MAEFTLAPVPTLQTFERLQRLARSLGWGRLTQFSHVCNDPALAAYGEVSFWWESARQYRSFLQIAAASWAAGPSHLERRPCYQVRVYGSGSRIRRLRVGQASFVLPASDAALERIADALVPVFAARHFRTGTSIARLRARFPDLVAPARRGSIPPPHAHWCVVRGCLQPGRVATGRRGSAPRRST